MDMPTANPQLPAPEELAAWIRDQRYLHDLSQTELAEQVGISPSQLSRIENQSGRATYQTLYEIQEALEELGDPTAQSVGDVLARKHEGRSEDYTLAVASPTESLAAVGQRMRDLDISQLPVFDAENKHVGRIADQDLIATAVDSHDPVEEHMRRPFPEIPADAPASTARNHLRTNEAVLVTAGDTDLEPHKGSVVGILSPADFAGETLE